MLLFFDTETTGLPDWHKPSEAPHQPRIVQLAAILTNQFNVMQGAMNVIIRPSGFEIPEEAHEIHGITTEKALRFGVPIDQALAHFFSLSARADKVIAHGVNFDKRMVRIEQHRAGADEAELDAWKGKPGLCTQVLASPICKLPPTAKMRQAGRNKFKTPKLGEAYERIVGKPFVEKHDALHDARACRAVYFAIQAMERAA